MQKKRELRVKTHKKEGENFVLKLGIFGAWRGGALMELCLKDKTAEIAAVCDGRDFVLDLAREKCGQAGVEPVFTKDFDEFLRVPMDAAILANNADEHAPYAMRLLERGVAVLSEVLPAKTLSEAVELVETVERTGAVYRYAENYCYFGAVREMRRLIEAGYLGEIEYAESEYLHNCEGSWHFYTGGERTHWRNVKHAFYYCSHSVGPVLFATGLRPAAVTGFEPPYNAKMRRMGALSAPFGLEIITLENGALFKSVHGETQKDSIWQCLYGSLGRAESSRECTGEKNCVYVSLDTDPANTCYENDKYQPQGTQSAEESRPHEEADRLMLEEFFAAVRGERDKGIDVYAAMDMWLPGMFAYKSVLSGGLPQKIPDFRIKAERERWRYDRSCPGAENSDFIPSYSKGNPETEEEVYLKQREKYLEDIKKFKEKKDGDNGKK